jgi:predicted transcriptional regulator
MTKKQIEAVLERVPDWPEDARRELARIALEIEADLGKGAYAATPEELRGIDRGLRDAAEGRFVSEAEVEAVFAKHRRG